MTDEDDAEEPFLLGGDLKPQKPNRPRQMRTQRLMPPEAFVRQDDGTVITAWGEVLPSVEESRKYLKELVFRYQKSENSREHIAAQLLRMVEVDPHKGCWTIDKRLHVITGYVPIHIPGESHPLDFHRLMFAISRGELRMGREWHLDHRCMNKPCGMPLHLEYETAEGNTGKGRRAHEIVNILEMGQASMFPQQDPTVT